MSGSLSRTVAGVARPLSERIQWSEDVPVIRKGGHLWSATVTASAQNDGIDIEIPEGARGLRIHTNVALKIDVESGTDWVEYDAPQAANGSRFTMGDNIGSPGLLVEAADEPAIFGIEPGVRLIHLVFHATGKATLDVF